MLSIVREGRINPSSQGVIAPEHPVWVAFAKYMMPILRFPAELLASRLIDENLKKSIKVLDVATGHGLFGISIAKLNQNAQVVAADWPNVLKVAQSNAISEGVGERISFLPGNILEIPLKENDYDLILIPNFLRHLGVKTIETFLSKIYVR